MNFAINQIKIATIYHGVFSPISMYLPPYYWFTHQLRLSDPIHAGYASLDLTRAKFVIQHGMLLQQGKRGPCCWTQLQLHAFLSVRIQKTCHRCRAASVCIQHEKFQRHVTSAVDQHENCCRATWRSNTNQWRYWAVRKECLVKRTEVANCLMS